MGAWLDYSVVGVLVGTSAAFALYRLGPARLRLWIRQQWARVRGRPLPVADTASGCANCANATAHARPGETAIPPDNIRRFGRTRS
jgi:hypothetical protein